MTPRTLTALPFRLRSFRPRAPLARTTILAALAGLALPGVLEAQAPFPGAVEVCVDGQRGWVPPTHPLAQSARCAAAVPPPAPTPGGIASRPLELGHLYMDGYGEVVRVIGLVRPTVIPGTFWVLESLGPRACGRLSYWPVDRPRGDGHWQEITEWHFTAPCAAPAPSS
jgi:hypothetical protein